MDGERIGQHKNLETLTVYSTIDNIVQYTIV